MSSFILDTTRSILSTFRPEQLINFVLLTKLLIPGIAGVKTKSMTNKLSKKVAVVTGGTSGIGFAIAAEFIREGAKVIITGRDQKKVNDAVSRIGENCIGIETDVSNIQAMKSLLEKVKLDHGRLDIIVANAAVGEHAPIASITEKQFDIMVHTNFKGVLFMVQSALPLMTSGGSIILIGSTASVAPPPGMSIYSAIKAGLRMMMRAVMQEIKGSGIRINLLSPGAVDTASLRDALRKATSPEKVDEMVNAMGSKSPIGRIGRPEELAKVACFLASDDSSYVNGIELFADGGLTQVV